jgi:hypothetical protein
MRRKTRAERFFLRLSKVEKGALLRLAQQRDIPASQIVRQAVKNTLAEAGTGTR